MKTRQIALIPAYEPTQLLCNLLEQAKQTGFELIVVESKRLRACKNTKTQRCCTHLWVFAYRNMLSEQQLQTHDDHPDIRTGLWNHQHADFRHFLAEQRDRQIAAE